jgi:hypothetical protein
MNQNLYLINATNTPKSQENGRFSFPKQVANPPLMVQMRAMQA